MSDHPPVPQVGLPVCGYCGSTIELDGEVLHLPDCPAPKTDGDEDVMDDDQ